MPSTLNCANYVYFLALEKCLELQNTKAVSFMTTELLNLHRGQGDVWKICSRDDVHFCHLCRLGRDIVWRETGRCPDISEYISMILDKTGGLFRMAVGLMQCFSSNTEDYTELVNLMAIYFQVRDDLINLANTSYHKNKSFCEDLTEGKFSFPLIHGECTRLVALVLLRRTNRSDFAVGIQNSPPGDTRLLAILKQRTQDDDVKLCAVNYLRETTKSFEFTKSYLKSTRAKIVEELDKIGGHTEIEKLMDLFAKEVDACT